VAGVPSSSRGGGGSAAPTTHAVYSSDTASTIADGGSALLLLTTKDGGDALLDVTTDSDEPRFIAAGVYAVTVVVQVQTEMTAGGVYTVQVSIDANADTPAIVKASSPPATVDWPAPQVVLGCTYYSTAGGVTDGHLLTRVVNLDGGAVANDFAISALVVQRLA
jgi:hypothetical protein